MSILLRAVSVPLSNSGNGLTCFYNRTAELSPIATSAVLFKYKVCPFCWERWVFHTPTQGMDLLAFTIERQYYSLTIAQELIIFCRFGNEFQKQAPHYVHQYITFPNPQPYRFGRISRITEFQLTWKHTDRCPEIHKFGVIFQKYVLKLIKIRKDNWKIR